MIQSIGRGLRNHPTKEKLLIIDFADAIYYGLDHLKIRVVRYQEERINYDIKDIYES